ncbi:hypothetical protein Tco_1459795, partial [Tanacetum coccineum]
MILKRDLLKTLKLKCQVKDNKIDLLVQQYEQFTIPEEESIDNAFARFNTIITSLKALDEGFSSKNHGKKFLRALHPKWRAKAKEKKSRFLALKAKKESSDEESSTFGSEDEEYTMAVRDFKNFFKRRGRFVREPRDEKKSFQRSKDDKNGQICDNKCKVIFSEHDSEITKDGKVIVFPRLKPLEDDDLVEEEAIKVSEKKPLGNDVEDDRKCQNYQ